MTAEGFKSQGEFTPENLIAGEFPRVTKIANVQGANLKAGSVLGVITASGVYTLSTSAANNGSQNVEAILAQDLAADGQAAVYLTGEFNETALSFGTGHTADSIRQQLRNKSIFLKKNGD